MYSRRFKEPSVPLSGDLHSIKTGKRLSWLPFPSRFAFHLLDSLAFFRGLEMVLGTLSPADMNFQEMISKYFVHFAKEGKLIVRFNSTTLIVNLTCLILQLFDETYSTLLFKGLETVQCCCFLRNNLWMHP